MKWQQSGKCSLLLSPLKCHDTTGGFATSSSLFFPLSHSKDRWKDHWAGGCALWPRFDVAEHLSWRPGVRSNNYSFINEPICLINLFPGLTWNMSGSLRSREPLESSREGGPWPVTWYRYSLNQMELTSGMAGPMCCKEKQVRANGLKQKATQLMDGYKDILPFQHFKWGQKKEGQRIVFLPGKQRLKLSLEIWVKKKIH